MNPTVDDDLAWVLKKLLRIRQISEHYTDKGNKHRSLMPIRRISTQTVAAVLARHPHLAAIIDKTREKKQNDAVRTNGKSSLS